MVTRQGEQTAVGRPSPFLARLRAGPLLCDGAMGTQLYARGVAPEACFEAQNLTRPQLVEAVHRDYILAGAQVVETNTYGANALKLAVHGLADQVQAINTRGARLAVGARESTGEPVFVAGAVGPLGSPLEPFGQISHAEAVGLFRQQIAALVGAGVDLLILETFADVAEIAAALEAARAVCDLPVVAQMTFTDDDLTPLGTTPEEAAARLGALGADVIGANCSVGPQHMLAVLERMAAALPTGFLLSAQPNAGWPSQVAGRIVYLSSPAYMARMARSALELGVRLVGGCCGTTPEHITALRAVARPASGYPEWRDPQAGTPSGEWRGSRAATLDAPVPSVAFGQRRASPPGETALSTQHSAPVTQHPSLSTRHSLQEKLGHAFVITAELRQPRGANPRKMLAGAALLRDAGVDAVNILDSARAKVLMSTLAAGVLVTREIGVEAILHMTTRDRNLMGLQSDLLGAHALGVRTILALTGDPPSIGPYAQAKGVYDVDSIGLIRIIARLNEGADVAGNSIGRPTEFLVGCGFNPAATDLGWEIERLHQKLEAGARFVMTQPIFDPLAFEAALDRCGLLPVPVLMGLLPPANLRNAEFLHNEMPGIVLTDEALERMRRAGPDGAAAEGLAIVRDVFVACRHLVAGVEIQPQFDHYDRAAQLVEGIRKIVTSD